MFFDNALKFFGVERTDQILPNMVLSNFLACN